MSMATRPTVLLTDRAWPDDSIERAVLDAGGFDLAAGPAAASTADVIEGLVREHAPVGIMTCWAPVNAAAIAGAPDLRIVARLGVGLDTIDVAAATAHGVQVTNVPDYCVPEVSDHAVAMVLNWSRGLLVADRSVHAGEWNPAGMRLRRLGALTCGIVGYGRIGRETARKLAAFGSRVLATSSRPPIDAAPAEAVDLPTLLRESDVVILHAPLTPATRHLVGAAELALMRPGALLVNVSRGGLVDTDALIAALSAGSIDAAALDVLDDEPHVPDALREHPRVLITPHIAFSSDLSIVDLRRSAAEEVVRVLEGRAPRHPQNTPTQVSRTRDSRTIGLTVQR